jgi:hypothetical protein
MPEVLMTVWQHLQQAEQELMHAKEAARDWQETAAFQASDGRFMALAEASKISGCIDLLLSQLSHLLPDQ